MSKSIQLGICVRDDLRVTQAVAPAAVTCESRCLETKRANVKPLLLQMCEVSTMVSNDWRWRVFGYVQRKPVHL